MENILEKIPVTNNLFHVLTNDVKESAKAAGLVYVASTDPGFSRIRRGKKFIYMNGGEELTDKEHLDRISRLVIPPAWENIWICKIPDGHIQATGYDKKSRKQYRYHNLWIEFRNKTKFYRLKEFGERLPLTRQNLEKDLSLKGFPQNKVLAAMISLLERINIRVGNLFYEKLYGSFGLTTLKNHHVKINGSKLHLMFRGKKGILHNITLSSKKLAKIIQGCKEIPGKELFEYYDEEGNICVVDSGMLNDYIRKVSESDFTAKDFRTWAGTVTALLAFKTVGHFSTVTDMNKKVPEALDIVAKHLGNTRAVCRKYYVHPLILDLYQSNQLDKYLNELNDIELENEDSDGYVAEERILLKILGNT